MRYAMCGLWLTGVVWLAGAASGEETRPAATRPYFVLVVPQGFEKITAGGHRALCEPANTPWVRKALEQAKPASRPTTMPADLLTRATAQRDPIVKQLSQDLGLPDDKMVAEFYDGKLLPRLKKFQEINPPIFFMVCTRDKLKSLVAGGWGEPRFYYNRVADAVSYDQRSFVSIDRTMEESVLPHLIDEKTSEEARLNSLRDAVTRLDQELVDLVSRQSQAETYNLIAEFLASSIFEPLKLGQTTRWFMLGATPVLASKYTAMLSGETRQSLMNKNTQVPERFPISLKSIDLLRPLAESQMRQGAYPLYTLAMRVRATVAVAKLVEKAGDGAIAKALAALRADPAMAGPALVKAIGEATKVDLTSELQPQ